MIQLVADSSCDLPKELLEKYHIAIVPLSISLEGKSYQEGVDITPTEFFQRMFASKDLPMTSQPSPSAFAGMFKELAEKGEILCLTISSGLSGTYQSACLGKELSGAPVTIWDTLGGSLAHGFQVMKAAELAVQGLSIQQIIERLKQYREQMNILVLLNTLENIVKGGRLSRFQGSVAKILDMKLLLEGVNGKVELLEKIRGKKKFLQRALDIAAERKRDFSETIFGITHAACLEEAEALKAELIQRFHPKGVLINYMGATMGTYAGKSGMILSFY